MPTPMPSPPAASSLRSFSCIAAIRSGDAASSVAGPAAGSTSLLCAGGTTPPQATTRAQGWLADAP